ncbi:MAG: hypothetical protein LC791_16315 [Acidobacteria bacterium]|nr:hypothetical protein [Acidobacteriota bacterium]
MKTTTFAMTAVLACTVTAFAQSGTSTAQPATKGMPADGSMMVTGCVAQGTAPGTFMLNNATMAHGGAMAKETTTTSDPKMSGSGAAGTSYALVGGENLKAHVGHKVEVTGMVDKTAKMDDKSATPGMAGKDMKVQTLTVKAVKMVSATCP